MIASELALRLGTDFGWSSPADITAAIGANVPGYYLIALVVARGAKGDYHWLRQDDSGLWSHKPGHLQATNRERIAAVGRLSFFIHSAGVLSDSTAEVVDS